MKLMFSFVNLNESGKNCGLFTLSKEILNGKTKFATTFEVEIVS